MRGFVIIETWLRSALATPPLWLVDVSEVADFVAADNIHRSQQPVNLGRGIRTRSLFSHGSAAFFDQSGLMKKMHFLIRGKARQYRAGLSA